MTTAPRVSTALRRYSLGEPELLQQRYHRVEKMQSNAEMFPESNE